MKAKLVNIGKSKGLILPQAILDKYKITDSVEMVFGNEGLILKPNNTPRKGWEKAFKEMHKKGDDALLINDVFEDEDLST